MHFPSLFFRFTIKIPSCVKNNSGWLQSNLSHIGLYNVHFLQFQFSIPSWDMRKSGSYEYTFPCSKLTIFVRNVSDVEILLSSSTFFLIGANVERNGNYGVASRKC